MALDLTLFSLYRINGQELPTLPGLMAVTPPRKVARGREREPLIVALLLSGNTPFSTADYMKLTSEAAAAFYGAPGALTSALRTAAEAVNRGLLERNLATTGRGQYAVGALTLAALRDTQLTILQCGPTHVLALHAGETRHWHDPALSGKGIGLNQTFSQYFSQITLQPGDRLLLCPKLPPAWESALASDRGLQQIETTRKRMLSIVEGDLNAALIQVSDGPGAVNIIRSATATVSHTPLPTPEPVDATPRVPAPEPAASPPPAAHMLGRPPEDQPSAYAIPAQPVEDDEALVEQLAEAAMPREFPPSIPRLQPAQTESAPVVQKEAPAVAETTVSGPRVPSAVPRQAARLAVSAIQAWRRTSASLAAWFRKFLPRLLPESEADTAMSIPTTVQIFIAIAVPVIVAVIGFMVFKSLGQPAQFDTLIAQAKELRALALNETDPALQRDDWKNVLARVDAFVSRGGDASEVSALRQEAQTRLDTLEGVTRVNFAPVFASKLNAVVSRMAANESDLYMLDATQGKILRATLTGRGYELDATFNCSPGENSGSNIGQMVDLLILPKLNLLNSSAIGVDAAGNLLYCAPGEASQPQALTPPPTNWGRVTAMTFDSNRLYVLDAPSSAVWVYRSKEDTITFPDPPYFFFGSQIPDIKDAIDITASGDELYLLHSDGHLTHCTFSRVESVPTRCDSPVALTNPFPAYGTTNVFAAPPANFTQMSLTALPDAAVLLLDADGRMVFRISLRTFELQSIFGMAGGAINVTPGPFTAMTVSPNHVLYLARGDQVYFSTDAP
jgi:hypothetical protein